MDKDLQVCFDLTTEIMARALCDARQCLGDVMVLPYASGDVLAVALALFNARFGLLMDQARDLQKVSVLPPYA